MRLKVFALVAGLVAAFIAGAWVDHRLSETYEDGKMGASDGPILRINRRTGQTWVLTAGQTAQETREPTVQELEHLRQQGVDIDKIKGAKTAI